MKKPSRTTLRGRADKLWREAIRERDGHCVMDFGADFAGVACEGRLEAAHIHPRRHYGTRWEKTNGVLLCARHHRMFDGVFDRWAWAAARLGEAEWTRLCLLARNPWDKDYTKVFERLAA